MPLSRSAALSRVVEGFWGIRRVVFLTNRAHLFHRRSQWEAVLLISLGQTLACVKCLQNQYWRGPRALVDICVCFCVSVCEYVRMQMCVLICMCLMIYLSKRRILCQFAQSSFLAGSRVSTELRYTREKQGEESVFTSQMLIQTPKEEGTNVLTQDALLVHMEAALSASKVQVSLFGK